MCLNDNIISSHLMKLRYLKVNHLLSVEHSNLEEGKLEEEASGLSNSELCHNHLPVQNVFKCD